MLVEECAALRLRDACAACTAGTAELWLLRPDLGFASLTLSVIGDRLHLHDQHGTLPAQTIRLRRGQGWRTVQVLLCPRCGRTARVLYLPPGYTRYWCRACYGLTYLSQRPGPSARRRAEQDHTDERLEQQVQAATEQVDRLYATTGATEYLSGGRLVVMLNRPTGATRPRGRPRTHRAYRRRTPAVLSPVKPGVLQAFCPRCRDRRTLVDGVPVVFRNGRPAVRGYCAECGAGMARIVAGEQAGQGEE